MMGFYAKLMCQMVGLLGNQLIFCYRALSEH